MNRDRPLTIDKARVATGRERRVRSTVAWHVEVSPFGATACMRHNAAT